MDDKKPDAKTIAEEAVGERRSPDPEAAKDKPEMPTEEAIRRLATSAGPLADLSVKTAESVGERLGDAYATTDEVKARPENVARRAVSQAGRAAQQPFVAVAAGFALGYAAALLIHRRQ